LEARYSGDDNVLGKANVRYIEGANVVGVDLADPYAQDDFVVTELHIPKGKKILFKMRSGMYCIPLICHILEHK
jgi:cytochrome c oxidase subunit 2